MTIRLEIKHTAQEAREALAVHWEYIVWDGRIVGLEATEDARLAFLRVRNADRVIEAAADDAAGAGVAPFDADPIEVSAILVTSDRVEIPTRVWMDKAEAAKCSAS